MLELAFDLGVTYVDDADDVDSTDPRPKRTCKVPHRENMVCGNTRNESLCGIWGWTNPQGACNNTPGGALPVCAAQPHFVWGACSVMFDVGGIRSLIMQPFTPTPPTEEHLIVRQRALSPNR